MALLKVPEAARDLKDHTGLGVDKLPPRFFKDQPKSTAEGFATLLIVEIAVDIKSKSTVAQCENVFVMCIFKVEVAHGDIGTITILNIIETDV